MKLVKEKKEKKLPVQEKPISKFEEHFTHEDIKVILEAAIQAFQNEEIFTILSERLDLTDDHLHDLSCELQRFLEEDFN